MNITQAITKAIGTIERPALPKALNRRTYPATSPLTGRARRRAVGLRGAFVQGAPYRRVRSLRSLGLMPKAVDVAEGTYGADELFTHDDGVLNG